MIRLLPASAALGFAFAIFGAPSSFGQGTTTTTPNNTGVDHVQDSVGRSGVQTGLGVSRITTTPGAPSVQAALPVPPTEAAGAIPDVNHVRRLVREVRENTDNIQSKGNFGAQLWLVQGTAFFEQWRKPGAPTIDPITIAPRGQTISTVIIFYGTARDNKGLCNVDYDIVVKRPNGTIYNRRDDLIGWQDLAPTSDRQLMLGRNYVSIEITPDDPAGLYTVEVTVRDNIARVELPLKQTFVVQ